ncbi:hypothetical protein [Arthrobacter sp. 35W]|uniref:hypothetical protein n=1 Tax=Arthrobacter sp. 35W TaxID=1132441 RepID=UPI00041432D7|nr:hypothetical protein [Arthrobacter sp. 35W]
MKRWLAPMAVTGLLVAGAGPAVAAPPTNIDGTTISWPCPQFTQNVTLVLTGKSKTINLPGGGAIGASPNLRVTATAPNGHSASYVITGALHITFNADGSQNYIATGRNLNLVPAANGHPSGLSLTTGTWTFALNPDFSEKTPLAGSGTRLEVCQVLAG